MKYSLFALCATCSLSFGNFVTGVGYANLNQTGGTTGSSVIEDLNIGVVYLSLGYDFDLLTADKFRFVPEIRVGTGLTDSSVTIFSGLRSATVDVGVSQFMSLNLRGEYDFTDQFYGYANVAYTYSEVELSAGSFEQKADDWELGFGVGIGYHLTSSLSLEANLEFYDSTTLIGGALRYSF